MRGEYLGNKNLGRKSYIGRVVAGRKKGKKLGFPTANVVTRHKTHTHRLGVYVGYVLLRNKILQALIYIGPSITFHEHDVRIEIYLLHWKESIYGERIQFTLIHKIRMPMQFPSPQALRSQMKKDLFFARRYFRLHPMKRAK